MAGALQHAEILAPGADGLAVLVSEKARDLVQMGHVVSRPGREQLRQGDRAERGVQSAALEIARLQVHGANRGEVFSAQPGEIVEQLRQRFSLALANLGEAVERLEGLGIAVQQNALYAGDPIGPLAVGEVSDDVVGGPGVFAFVTVGPDFRLVTKERVESDRGAREQRKGFVEVESHGLNCSSF